MVIYVLSSTDKFTISSLERSVAGCWSPISGCSAAVDDEADSDGVAMMVRGKVSLLDTSYNLSDHFWYLSRQGKESTEFRTKGMDRGNDREMNKKNDHLIPMNYYEKASIPLLVNQH